ncbi:hypothetical protein OCU_19660 [Mycobacterium intracellulare ATCC 13950]|uniref:Uncharacterized protein n=1 Tax=Mycobacterium intracellulare (strain ATCC 13950 / DSM 43223 / JCM 6384 / NCTC 13025 / 3600) TaxID=487521 RepID=H8IS57_MYCIA|nr:hypothetical protein OCU_19660 [Mycobacterium intracellulare ATCC 13950]ETZ36960.1 hypothetical protein L843_2199 [Mycobacterium intracellulare MIN_061107_1834]
MRPRAFGARPPRLEHPSAHEPQWLTRPGDSRRQGVLADYEAVADIDALARGIGPAVAHLVAISKQRKRTRGRRGSSLVANV